MQPEGLVWFVYVGYWSWILFWLQFASKLLINLLTYAKAFYAKFCTLEFTLVMSYDTYVTAKFQYLLLVKQT